MVIDGLGDLEVRELRLSLDRLGTGRSMRPVIHGGHVTVPNAGFIRIVGGLLGDEIDVPQVRLRYVSSRLVHGGAEVVLRARRGFLDQNVHVGLELAPAGNGDLRVTIARLRVGPLPADWLLDFLLGAVERVEGLRHAGGRAIDVNIAALLASRDVPVDLAAGVSGVEVTAEALTLRF